jgi:hypothetical protein
MNKALPNQNAVLLLKYVTCKKETPFYSDDNSAQLLLRRIR